MRPLIGWRTCCPAKVSARVTGVALVLERSAQAVVAMLAVLKTGAAYLAIDPALPDARIELHARRRRADRRHHHHRVARAAARARAARDRYRRPRRRHPAQHARCRRRPPTTSPT